MNKAVSPRRMRISWNEMQCKTSKLPHSSWMDWPTLIEQDDRRESIIIILISYSRNWIAFLLLVWFSFEENWLLSAAPSFGVRWWICMKQRHQPTRLLWGVQSCLISYSSHHYWMVVEWYKKMLGISLKKLEEKSEEKVKLKRVDLFYVFSFVFFSSFHMCNFNLLLLHSRLEGVLRLQIGVLQSWWISSPFSIILLTSSA